MGRFSHRNLRIVVKLDELRYKGTSSSSQIKKRKEEEEEEGSFLVSLFRYFRLYKYSPLEKERERLKDREPTTFSEISRRSKGRECRTESRKWAKSECSL